MNIEADMKALGSAQRRHGSNLDGACFVRGDPIAKLAEAYNAVMSDPVRRRNYLKSQWRELKARGVPNLPSFEEYLKRW